MTAVSISPDELQQGFTALSDLMIIVQNGLGDKAADEKLLSDGFVIAEGTFPEYALALMAANFLIDMVITYNRSAEPGALSHIAGGNRGNIPGQTGGAAP